MNTDDNKKTSDVTDKGKQLIEHYFRSMSRLSQAEQRLHSEKLVAIEAQIDLASWLLPEDAKNGEKIAVWYGDSLIQVEVKSMTLEGDFCKTEITIRKRGRSLSQ